MALPAAFVNYVSAHTGLSPRVVAAWTQAEGGPAGNPLNIGPGRNYGNPLAAAQAVAQLVNTSGYYSGIRQSIRTGSPAAQIAAIKASPWDAGHYGNGVLDRTFGSKVPMGVGPTPMAAGGTAAPPHQLAPNLGAILDMNNRMQGLDIGSVANLIGAAPQPIAQRQASAKFPGIPGPQPVHGPTLKFLEGFAQPFGLTVTSTTGGQHAAHSYHYLGRAADFGGDASRMSQLANYALQHPGEFTEMFYTGPGHPNYFISGGKVLPLNQLDPFLYREHENHVHLAR